MNRIKECISMYNQRNMCNNVEKMTQARLAESVIESKVGKAAKHQLMVAWIREERKISFVEIRNMCKILDTTADYLLGVDKSAQ